MTPPSGVTVDDYYEDADGSDASPTLQRAFAYALDNNIPVVTFSPRTYELQSHVASIHGINPQCAVRIASDDFAGKKLIIEGNGATLYLTGSNYSDALYFELAGGELEIRNLNITRVHSAITSNLCTGGIIIEPNENGPDMERVVIENCRFSGCNRGLNLGMNAGRFLRHAYGKLKSVLVRNCTDTHPTGSNLDATLYPYGGSQGMYGSAWVHFLEIDGMVFDGAETGDVTGIDNQNPVDGMYIGEAVHTVIRNSLLRHFAAEGLFFLKQAWFAGTEGTFTVAAIGSNFNLPIAGIQKTLGYLAGERLKLSGYADGQFPIYTHEFEIVSIVDSHTLSVKTISGTAGEITTSRPLTHELYWKRDHTAKSIDNTFQDILVIPRQTYMGIEFRNVDHVEGRGTVIDSCSTCIRASGAVSVQINDNPYLGTTESGISQGGSDPAVCQLTVANNHVEMLGTTPYVGIQYYAPNALLSGNSVWMGAAISNYGNGIRGGVNVTGARIIGNTFRNLAKDVEPEYFTNHNYFYGYDNRNINVATPQTLFPPSTPLGSISGLGTGVSALLATPTSANARAAITDKTGTGAMVFAGGDIGAATATTATAANNSTTVATTAFVQGEIASQSVKLTGTQTIAGAKTFSGQTELTGQTAASATSAITRALGDARYGNKLRLVLASNISSSSTTPVSYGTTLSVPAGTYKFEICVVVGNAGTTAGAQCGFDPSLTTVDTTTAVASTSISTADGASNSASGYSRFGTNLFQYANGTFLDGNTGCHRGQAIIFGTVTFSSAVTITANIKQRTTTDASNAAVMYSGSFIEFTQL